jgi:hypothetical protein
MTEEENADTEATGRTGDLQGVILGAAKNLDFLEAS